MEESKTSGWTLAFIFMCFAGGLAIYNASTTNRDKADAVKEYLSHPENYAIQYVYPKGDTIPVDTIVIYLK